MTLWQTALLFFVFQVFQDVTGRGAYHQDWGDAAPSESSWGHVPTMTVYSGGHSCRSNRMRRRRARLLYKLTTHTQTLGGSGAAMHKLLPSRQATQLTQTVPQQLPSHWAVQLTKTVPYQLPRHAAAQLARTVPYKLRNHWETQLPRTALKQLPSHRQHLHKLDAAGLAVSSADGCDTLKSLCHHGHGHG